jgi:spermidine synthase
MGAPGMTDYRFISWPTLREAEAIVELYRQAGWWGRGEDPHQVMPLIAGSYCFVLAETDGQIVGMGRAISDGVADAYIQDVTVLVAHRKRGIAGSILGKIVKRLKDDGINWIGLIAEEGTLSLYLAAGFVPMTGGTPMVLKYYE